MKSELTELKRDLFQAAQKARELAYAPYSKYQVGAAVLMDNGKIYGGCNVENASYGGTNCAERTAIFKAISESPSRKIKEVLVITDADQPWPPCGICRQVIAEFATQDTPIYVANLKGIQKTFKLKDLLPEAFTGQFLTND